METTSDLPADEMDQSEYFLSTVNEMEWADVLSTVHNMVYEMLGEPSGFQDPVLPLPPSPTPPSPVHLTSPPRHATSPIPTSSPPAKFYFTSPLPHIISPFASPTPPPPSNPHFTSPFRHITSPLPFPSPPAPSPLYFTSPLPEITSPFPSPSPTTPSTPHIPSPPHHITSPFPCPSPPPPTPPYSPPSPVPALSGLDTHLQVMGNQNGGSQHVRKISLAAAPNMFEQPLMAPAGMNAAQAPPVTYQAPMYDPNFMQSGHLNNQAHVYSQGQFLPNQWPVNDAPRAVPVFNPAAPLHVYNNIPVLSLPQGVCQNLPPVAMINGEVVYNYLPNAPTYYIPAPPPPPPPASASVTKKRTRGNTADDGQPYIKKPPNAFMLYRKEQRQNVIEEMGVTDSALINTILGKRWKSLSAEEKARYFEEAERERFLHSQKHPNWSSSDNYGKKRKRSRTKAHTSPIASTSTSEEDTQVAKRPCTTSVQSAEMEPSTSQANTAQNNVQTVPMCYMCYRPQVLDQTSQPNSAAVASTATVPHVNPTGTEMTNHPVTDHRAA